jgi:hypothetical protein
MRGREGERESRRSHHRDVNWEVDMTGNCGLWVLQTRGAVAGERRGGWHREAAITGDDAVCDEEEERRKWADCL